MAIVRLYSARSRKIAIERPSTMMSLTVPTCFGPSMPGLLDQRQDAPIA